MSKKHGIYIIDNSPVEIVSVTGGWTTYKDADGATKKARNSLIKPTDAPVPAPAKADKTEAKPIKPARKVAKTESGEEVTVSPALVQPDYTRYTKHEVKSPSGRKALDINDSAAALLRGHDISDCYFIVAKNMAKLDKTLDPEVVEKELTKQYKHLNIGMQRMNLGNRLRKAMGTYGNLNAHKSPRVAKPKVAKPAKVKADKPQASNQTIYVKPGTNVTVKVDRRKSARSDRPGRAS